MRRIRLFQFRSRTQDLTRWVVLEPARRALRLVVLLAELGLRERLPVVAAELAEALGLRRVRHPVVVPAEPELQVRAPVVAPAELGRLPVRPPVVVPAELELPVRRPAVVPAELGRLRVRRPVVLQPGLPESLQAAEPRIQQTSARRWAQTSKALAHKPAAQIRAYCKEPAVRIVPT